MPHAYTPGLTVAERTTIRRLRLLPLVSLDDRFIAPNLPVDHTRLA